MRCNGDCDQGRKPCTCELDADHGDFVSPVHRAIENLLMIVVVIIAGFGLFSLLWSSV